jgi:leucyl aminopeptidase
MITVKAGTRRKQGAPHAVGVLAGRVAAERGDQAAIDRAGSSLDQQDFTGKAGQLATVVDDGTVLLLAGLGEDVDALRSAAGVLARSLGRSTEATTSLHKAGLDDGVRPVVEGLLLGGYSFDRFRSEPPTKSTEVGLLGAAASDIEAAAIPARAQAFARDLVNTPSRDKSPTDLAHMISARAAEAGIEVDVWEEEKIRSERLNGLLTVAAGSVQPPRFVRLTHKPKGARSTLALVGKGIVFDSGGLSLKTAEGMETMKTDMSGAAVVAAAMVAIANLGISVRVEGFLPLTENMPGGSATRPGDVITYRNQKTAEVLNTDAEGRLVLGDGLILAAEMDPDLIVDVATLTGAARVALGDRIGGVWGNRRQDIDLVVAAGAFTGDRLWPMPLPSDYRKNIDSEVADMKNTGGPYGGAINAALFLKEFVGDRPWVHLDIAGPARATENFGWTVKGGTGFGTRALVRLAEMIAER